MFRTTDFSRIHDLAFEEGEYFWNYVQQTTRVPWLLLELSADDSEPSKLERLLLPDINVFAHFTKALPHIKTLYAILPPESSGGEDWSMSRVRRLEAKLDRWGKPCIFYILTKDGAAITHKTEFHTNDKKARNALLYAES